MTNKRSIHELKRLLQLAFAEECRLPRPGLWLCIDDVVPHGTPPHRLDVWATLHFSEDGSPFCCGEPGCHLGLFERLTNIEHNLRRKMHLRQEVRIDLGEHQERLATSYSGNVRFIQGPLFARAETQPDNPANADDQ